LRLKLGSAVRHNLHGHFKNILIAYHQNFTYPIKKNNSLPKSTTINKQQIIFLLFEPKKQNIKVKKQFAPLFKSIFVNENLLNFGAKYYSISK
jgi:hypothetical protein